MTFFSATDILNPELDLAPYRAEFERSGRVRIPDILKADFAEEVYAVFQRAPWAAIFQLSGKTASVTSQDLAAAARQDLVKLRNQIFAGTVSGFQYSYLSVALKDAQGASWDESQVLPALSAFMNSDAYLEIGRTVSGFEGIRSITAQATHFTRESFLCAHDDVAEHKSNRLLAYVMGFSKDWIIDWGGLLQFFDKEGGGVVESLIPTFNGLTLFRVPQWHSVSFVTPFARGPRYSVTGWYYGEQIETNGDPERASE